MMLMVPLLFLAGVAFGYYLVLPPAISFLQNFNDTNFDVLLQAKDYYRFSVLALLSTGLVFQLPVGLLTLNTVGILSGRQLRSSWRYAVVAIAVVAAVLPGVDPVTTVILMVPLLVLYLLSILLLTVADRRRGDRDESRRSRIDGDEPRKSRDAVRPSEPRTQKLRASHLPRACAADGRRPGPVRDRHGHGRRRPVRRLRRRRLQHERAGQHRREESEQRGQTASAGPPGMGGPHPRPVPDGRARRELRPGDELVHVGRQRQAPHRSRRLEEIPDARARETPTRRSRG